MNGVLKVGKSYDFLRGPEGAFFDMMDGGAVIIIRYNGMTKEEETNFRTGKFQMKITVLSGIIFLLVRFDSEKIDIPYHVMLSKNLTELQEIREGEGIHLTVFAGDAQSGELKVLRSIGLDTKTSKILQREIAAQFGEFDPQKYDRDLDAIYTKYSYQDLEKFSIRS